MRLWHYKLLPYLPQPQLIAQKRECDLMIKDYQNGKKTNHILINYVWEYPIYCLELYYGQLADEFSNRGLKFKSKIPFPSPVYFANPFPKHHDNRYLIQNFYNLQEKFDRNQKGFTQEQYKQLEEFMEKRGLI